MNWILRNKKKNSKALLVVLFLVFNFFVFNIANAAETAPGQCMDNIASPARDVSISANATSQTACDDYCGKIHSGYTKGCTFTPGPMVAQTAAMKNGSKVQQSGFFTNIFLYAIGIILEQVQYLVGLLFAMAASLFAWVIDPANVSGPNGMLNKQAVKDVWIMVRDLLNMTFILILLFAAFCTIFRVDKWNLKKVWLNILINALLVNFSFPIARFFIDVSNVAFYYFVKNLFAPASGVVTGSSIMAGFGAASNISQLLKPDGYATEPIAYQIAIIVVLFMMGMTLIIIAALFVVRLVALTMIIMFSPIGFVGYIFPSSSKYADKWWSNLFSYSFFAPIMIFMMNIALRVTESLKNENLQNLIKTAGSNTSTGETNFIANAAFFIIPILILWMGMGVAKKFGIEGADTVVSNVKKGGKWLANAPLHATGISGGAKLGWENFKKKGPLMGSNVVEERSARIGRLLGDKTALRELQAKRIKESGDKYDMANMTEDELRSIRGSKFDNAATKVELANRNRTRGTEELDAVREEFGEDSQVFRKLQAKVKTYDVAAAFAHLDPAERETRIADFVNSNQFKAKDLSASALSANTPEARTRNAEALSIAFREQDMNAGDLEELRKKNVPGVRTLIGDVATTRDAGGAFMFSDVDHATLGARNREVQLAHLAQTGEFSTSIAGNRAAVQRVLREGNENTLKRVTVNTVNSAGFLDDFETNVSQAKLSKILPTMAEGNPDAARIIIAHLTRAGGRHRAYILGNPNLRGLNP